MARCYDSLLRVASITVVSMVMLAMARPACAGTIPWETNLDRARTTALQTHRPVLVEFWAVWCPGCEEMDRNVYGDEQVASAMRKVTPARIDIDREPMLARHYEVTATPTLLLMDAYGNELFRFTGTLARDRVLQMLAEVPADISRLNTLAGEIAAKKDDFTALAAMGHELRAQAFYRASTRFFTRALDTRDGRRPTEARREILLASARNAVAIRAYAEAAQSFAQSLREFPDRPDEPDLLLNLAQAQAAQGKNAEARKTLDQLVARHPRSKRAADAARLRATL
jgi:thioredoxin 1